MEYFVLKGFKISLYHLKLLLQCCCKKQTNHTLFGENKEFSHVKNIGGWFDAMWCYTAAPMMLDFENFRIFLINKKICAHIVLFVRYKHLWIEIAHEHRHILLLQTIREYSIQSKIFLKNVNFFGSLLEFPIQFDLAKDIAARTTDKPKNASKTCFHHISWTIKTFKFRKFIVWKSPQLDRLIWSAKRHSFEMNVRLSSILLFRLEVRLTHSNTHKLHIYIYIFGRPQIRCK